MKSHIAFVFDVGLCPGEVGGGGLGGGGRYADINVIYSV